MPSLRLDPNHLPGCHGTKMYTATTTGRNSRHPKKTSCVDNACIRPCAVSARRKQVLRYTAMVAVNTAAANALNIEVVTFLDFRKKTNKHKMKSANENTWNASPASRMLLGMVGFLRFEYAEPTKAAPTIWTMVATTSHRMKPHKMSLGGRGAYWRPTLSIMTVMMVYMAAEKNTGATTMKKYCTTKYGTEYGSFCEDKRRKM